MSNPTPTPTGLRFPVNASGKSYISVYYHRNGRVGKSQWAASVTEAFEFGYFCEADQNDWLSENGDYWNAPNGGRLGIGTEDERLCKFEKPSNPTDDWHGYPTTLKRVRSSRHPENIRTQEVQTAVQMLIDKGVIDETVGVRLQKGKL